MSAAWDGLPQNPERDGWHQMNNPDESGGLFVSGWIAAKQQWDRGSTPEEAVEGWCEYGYPEYIGPMVTWADHTAALAVIEAEVARKDAALRAAYDHIAAPSRMQKDGSHTVCTYRMGPGRYNEITSMLRGAIPGERGA